MLNSIYIKPTNALVAHCKKRKIRCLPKSLGGICATCLCLKVECSFALKDLPSPVDIQNYPKPKPNHVELPAPDQDLMIGHPLLPKVSSGIELPLREMSSSAFAVPSQVHPNTWAEPLEQQELQEFWHLPDESIILAGTPHDSLDCPDSTLCSSTYLEIANQLQMPSHWITGRVTRRDEDTYHIEQGAADPAALDQAGSGLWAPQLQYLTNGAQHSWKCFL